MIPLRRFGPYAALLVASGCGQLDLQALSYTVKSQSSGGRVGISGHDGTGGSLSGSGGITGGSGGIPGGNRLDASLDADDARTLKDHSETPDVAHREAGPITRPEAGLGDSGAPLGPILPPGFDDVWDGVPLCNGYTNGPPWGAGATDIAAVTFINDTSCCAIYAVLKSHYVVVAWRGNSPTGWIGWQCLDFVPDAERLTVVNLQHKRSEVFALGNGLIWVKHEYSDDVAPRRGTWLHVARPSGVAQIRDIHAFVHFTAGQDDIVGTDPRLLALSENAVFIRARQDPYFPYSAFAEWQKVATVNATRVCGGFASDGHIEVYAIDEQKGSLLVSTNAAPDGSVGAFSNFTEVAPPALGARFSEIECVVDSSLDLQVWARTKSGLYWSIPSSSKYKNWTPISQPQAGGPVLFTAATPLLNTPGGFGGSVSPFWVNQSDGSVSIGGLGSIFHQPMGQ